MSRKKNKRKYKISSGKKSSIKNRIPSGKLSFDFDIDTEIKKAVQYHQSGQLEKAEEIYKEILEINPNHSDSLHLSGIIAHQFGKNDIAVNLINNAIQSNPKSPIYYLSLGSVFKDQGNLEEAALSYQKALQLNPNYAEAYNNMGNAFKDQGNLEAAILNYQKALKLNPKYAEAYNNMGNAFKAQGRLDEAILNYQKALQLNPHLAMAYNNIGAAFKDQGNLEEAILNCQKALQLNPDLAEAYDNMGNALQDQGNLDEAVSFYQKALEIKPDFAEAYSQLFHQLQRTCDWQKLEGMTAKLDSFTKDALSDGTKPAETPFIGLTKHADLSRNFAIAKSWSQDIVRAMSSLKIHFPLDMKRSCKTKISIGYLSNDFRNHPTAHLMLSLFGLHNRDEFEIFCYSYGEDDGSYYRERIQRDCDKFVDLRNLNHGEAAKCIYEDQVDILVDLKGYTRANRLEICALRPAPIQVSYLGFPGTSGAGFFDYIITDRIVTPEDHAPYYSENFVCLPHCYQVNDHTQAISNKDWKKVDYGLPEGSFVFCSFNWSYKIEPAMFDIWMRIFQQVPEAVLWLLLSNETAEKNLRLEAEARGVKSERLIFTKKLSKDQHLGRLRLADLALDTRIVNGHTTTSDALWAGVPVITLEGNHFASRVSSSILTAIGMSELIAHSLEEYEALALGFARDQYELQTIKQKIAKNRLTEPLFDTPRFARNLEKAYKEMWEIFVNGERPQQIEVVEE